MNKVGVVLLVAAGVAIYSFWSSERGVLPSSEVPATPYIVVYGRDTCGITSRMRRGLSGKDAAFDYRVVDEPAVADDLHQKMDTAGLDTRRYNLPVVEVNGRVLVRPKVEQVLDLYADF